MFKNTPTCIQTDEHPSSPAELFQSLYWEMGPRVRWIRPDSAFSSFDSSRHGNPLRGTSFQIQPNAKT